MVDETETPRELTSRELKKEARQERRLAKKELRLEKKQNRKNFVSKGLKATQKSFNITAFDTFKHDRPKDIRNLAKDHIKQVDEEGYRYERKVNNNIYLLALVLFVVLAALTLLPKIL